MTGDETAATTRAAYIAILAAAEAGRGIRLSAEEVFAISQDDAVENAALAVLTEEEERALSAKGWRGIRRPRGGRAP